MNYRGFKIIYSDINSTYSVDIRVPSNRNVITINSKNINVVRRKIDDIIDYKHVKLKDKNKSDFWTSI